MAFGTPSRWPGKCDWNYTTFLNIVFFAIAGGLVALTVRRGARDPVCGMTVDRHKTAFTAKYAGRTVYFCSAGCKQSFDEAPARYIDLTGREAAALEHAGEPER